MLISLLVIVLSAIVILFFNANSTSSPKNNNVADLYYLNPVSGTLESEKRTLNATTDENKIIEILQYLFETGPTNVNLRGLTDSKRIYQDIEIVDGTVTIYLNDTYKTLPSTTKIYVKAAITWSLTSITSIRNVIFNVDGKVVPLSTDGKVYEYDRSNVVLNPTIDTKDSVAMVLTLYFATHDDLYLSKEVRTVHVNPSNSKESYIVSELLKGTDVSSQKNLIPKESKIISVNTDNRVCYVNFSQDFISRQSSDFQKRKLCVYSIVNSLTELPNVDSVQIFIDSKKVEGFSKVLDLSNPLTRDASLIDNTKK